MKYYIKINRVSNNIYFTGTYIIWLIPEYVDKQGVDKYCVGHTSLLWPLAIARALPGFNDLGRTVTPTFLLVDHFLY